MAAKLTVRTTILITILKFLCFMTPFTKTIAQSPDYAGDDCQNSTKQPLTSAYQTNLNNILSWLSSDAATSEGHNQTIIGTGTPDVIYGLYDCRDDVTRTFCQFCVSTAASEIQQYCPNRTSAVMWYAFCILRYSNNDFFGKVATNPSWQVLGYKNITNPEEPQKAQNFMQSLIRKATVETNQLSAIGEFSLSPGGERYGLVQCSRDLTNKECSQCLDTLLEKVAQCCGTKVGWQVSAPSCVIKYDDYMFYAVTNQTSPSPLHVTIVSCNRIFLHSALLLNLQIDKLVFQVSTLP